MSMKSRRASSSRKVPVVLFGNGAALVGMRHETNSVANIAREIVRGNATDRQSEIISPTGSAAKRDPSDPHRRRPPKLCGRSMAVTSAMVIMGTRKNENAATAKKAPANPRSMPRKYRIVSSENGMSDVTQAKRSSDPRSRNRSASHPKNSGAMIPATGRVQDTALRRIPVMPCATSQGDMNGKNTPIDA